MACCCCYLSGRWGEEAGRDWSARPRDQRADTLDRWRTEAESDLISHSPSPTDTHPYAQHGAGHVPQVEINCMRTNLFSLAKTGSSPVPGRWRSVSLLSPHTHSGDPGKWGDFSERVCWKRRDHRNLSCSGPEHLRDQLRARGVERGALTNAATRGRQTPRPEAGDPGGRGSRDCTHWGHSTRFPGLGPRLRRPVPPGERPAKTRSPESEGGEGASLKSRHGGRRG